MGHPTPPAAPRRPEVLEAHGRRRVDEWYWLRHAHDPAVRAHLEAENAYTEALTAHQAPLRERLFEEFRGRTEETDEWPGVPWGRFWYHRRTVEGLDYAVHGRRPAGPAGADGPEQVVLDENRLAAGHDHFELRAFQPGPDHRVLAYGVSFDGGDSTELRFRDMPTGLDLPDSVASTSGDVAWAGDGQTYFYVEHDAALRPHRVMRRRLGDSPAAAEVVHTEHDERFRLSVERTRSGRFVVVSSVSTETTECLLIEADRPGSAPRLVEARQPGRRYLVDHHGPRLLIVTNDGGAVDYKLVEAPLASPGAAAWRDLVPARPGTRLHGIEVFRHHVVLEEQSGGVRRLQVMDPGGGPLSPVAVDEEVSTTVAGPDHDYDRRVLRFVHTSHTTPVTVYDHDLSTGERTMLKREPVKGGFDPGLYRGRRLWAVSGDGTNVPLSVVHRADTPVDGTAPAVLYGYGAYETSLDPWFSPHLLSLLDRGVVYAVAHVRGGGELGRAWYDQGRLLSKPSSVADFLACAEHLVAEGYAAAGRLAARGDSAGGLLVAAALNQRPDLFAAVVTQVPFVDVLTTMSDRTLPLTVGEFEEWGDPADPDLHACMATYSPYDNVRPAAYPAVLATAGLHDDRVGFWEPAKWVARLRANTTGQAPVLLRTEMGAGHGGPSGRTRGWRERAFVQAFVLDALGVGGRPAG